MQIINPNLTSITAFEVLQLIKDTKLEQEKNVNLEIESLEKQEKIENQKINLQQDKNTLTQRLIPKNLNDLINQFLIHFNQNNHLPQSNQSSDSILNLCSHLKNSFGQTSGNSNGLSRAERLQICDLAPTELVEIYLIIEECDSRFTESEIESILKLVKENLKPKTNQVTNENLVEINGNKYESKVMNEEEEEEGINHDINLGDIDDDDDLIAEAREGGPAPDQELDEVLFMVI